MIIVLVFVDDDELLPTATRTNSPCFDHAFGIDGAGDLKLSLQPPLLSLLTFDCSPGLLLRLPDELLDGQLLAIVCKYYGHEIADDVL